MSSLYRFFFESLLQPDDDFFTRSRKIILAFGAADCVYVLYAILWQSMFMHDNRRAVEGASLVGERTLARGHVAPSRMQRAG